MSDQLQLRGGPTAQSENFVGAEREITVDTGLKRLRIHDGSTPGGHILSGKVDLETAVAVINQTIDTNEAAYAQARADLKVLLEQELADLEAADAAARVLIQNNIDAEVSTSAAYDIIQDNRLSVLEAVSNISKKELEFITLIGSPSPAAGQVGVNSFTPSYVDMIVLPNTDINGNTVGAGDFLENDRIALKQPHGAAAIYFVDFAFTAGDHIRINVYDNKTILGAGGDLAYIENNEVSAVFEDNSVTRGAMTAGFSTEATARETAVASLTTLITALQTRADALEVDPVTKTYVDTQLNDLVNGAPDALNQLNEIIAAFEGADTNLIGDLSGLGVRITALESDTTSATAVAAVQADVDANETTAATAVSSEATTRAAADTALSGRLDVLEADDTTATALAAETAARIAADATNLAAAQTFATQAVANVIDASPAALDTLNEIAASLGDDADFITTITTSVAAVQTDVDANETAINASLASETTARTSADNILAGRLDLAEGKASYSDPTTQTLLSAETASRTTADTALSGRIDTLEADPTTQTLLSAEATTRSSADTALSARLDTAEAKPSYTDPTTQTLLSAETTSRVAADSALSARLDTAEAKTSYNDPTTQTLLTAETTARTAAVITLQTNIDTITTEQAAQEARLLQAGLFTGILYVSNFTGG